MYNQRNNKLTFEYFPQTYYRNIKSNLKNRLIYDKNFENIILPYFTFISDSIILINSFYYDLLNNKYYKYNLNSNKHIVVNNDNVISMLSDYFYPYNYGYWSEKYIDDIDFWENIVKAKENGKFKHLEEIDIDK